MPRPSVISKPGCIVGVYEIIKKVNENEPTSSSTKFVVRCTKCGDISVHSYNVIINSRYRKLSHCGKCRKPNKPYVYNIGDVIGKYEILEKVDKYLFRCKCLKCGKEVIVTESSIYKSEETQYPATCRHDIKRTFKDDIIGKVIGDYTVVGYLNKLDNHRNRIYIWRCAKCGRLILNWHGCIKRYQPKSCRHKLLFDKTKYKEEDYYIKEGV